MKPRLLIARSSFTTNDLVDVVLEIDPEGEDPDFYDHARFHVEFRNAATDHAATAVEAFQVNLSGTFAELSICPRLLSGYFRGTAGSMSPMPPALLRISCEIFVTTGVSLGWSPTYEIVQDPIDVLRQEYVDLPPTIGASPPAREDVVPSLGAAWNSGNYDHQLDDRLQARFFAIRDAYAGAPVMDAAGNAVQVDGQPVQIEPGAGLDVTSGYRCPRRNRAIGSTHPESRHVFGRALDIVPSPCRGIVPSGESVPLDLHAHVYPTLLAATLVALHGDGSAIAENGPVQVPVGDPSEDHVHVQW